MKLKESNPLLGESELGNVYEVSVHSEIAKVNGFHYSSRFEISDLLLGFYDSQIYLQLYHAEKVANYTYDKNMKN
ncbi:hypothetical protein GLOIN_2v1785677 [Rhizophagus clarus]|uniref:Uncharacterized protein n=1 Tax=Rhizophagus clarus TaxID=94130 RepID=A0A8H3R5F9_9GLOM|nr:hypothetical protein GLOIN_2v1785677 [Rhizophagus clarus]